jgi:glutamyl-Q tRNA(Asp) synthetase
LHLGSLLTAVASHVDAHAHGGQWLLRIEDLDGPRTVAGAAEGIRRSLRAHALHWDEEVPPQSARTTHYRDALAALTAQALTYPCRCSRSELAGEAIYPGTCRAVSQPALSAPHAVRVKVPSQRIGFVDRIQGKFEQNLAREVGDFIVLRKDGIFAYQLAVAVDDAAQGITDVVRGADLLDNTPRQLLLMQHLALVPPRYAHIPLICGRDGRKLSKQTAATAVAQRPPWENLLLALDLLGQAPPRTLRRAGPATIIAWACEYWRLERVPKGHVLTNYQCLC